MVRTYQSGIYAFAELRATSNDAASAKVAIFDEDNYSDASPIDFFNEKTYYFPEVSLSG